MIDTNQTTELYFPVYSLQDRIDVLEADNTSLERRLKEAELQLENYMYCPTTAMAVRKKFFEDVESYELVNGNESLHFVFIDIDGLKTFNDTLGHGAGDTLIQTAAASILTTYDLPNKDVMLQRLSDKGLSWPYRFDLDPKESTGEAISGRMGGDEFAVAIPREFMSDAEVFQLSEFMKDDFRLAAIELAELHNNPDVAIYAGMSVGIGESLNIADANETVVKSLGGNAVMSSVMLSMTVGEDYQIIPDEQKVVFKDSRLSDVHFRPRTR